MYCAKCKELMAGQTEIKNEEGYYHTYDRQLCKNCRTSDRMTLLEVERVMGIQTIKDTEIKLWKSFITKPSSN